MAEIEKDDEIQDELLNQLLDPDNTDPIVMFDENDKPVDFEQVAVIPIEDEVYVIMIPAEDAEVEGYEDGAFEVFRVDFDEEAMAILVQVEDGDIIEEVFNAYNELVDATE